MLPAHDVVLAGTGKGVVTAWLLLAGSAFALAFPSLASTETFFDIDPTIVRLMAAALAVVSSAVLLDHYGVVDLT